MNKKELLVPVGNKESLISAINAGCDAVYLAGLNYGARKYAKNFNNEEIKEAINLSHIYGVKVYVTVNTLIYDDEFEDAVEFIKYLHKSNVDAVIMQDIGLINYIHNILPNLEIHASTQMHIHNKYTLNFLNELGVKRVVFARELPLDYINNINTSLEKEVFIHGALCISYSGQCLFSSRVLNRSANRGMCAGMCRLPYKLVENNTIIDTEGNYLLSPKELCSIDNFKKLMDSNILSFKIEGRMKSPEYVYYVTKIYRDLMDKYYNNEELIVNKEDYDILTSIYNREFTKGYLNKDNDIMNIKSPNHQGLLIGKVIDYNKKKIKIKLIKDIHQYDSIRFKNSLKGCTINFIYDYKDNLINKGNKGSIIYIDNFLNINNLDDIYLTKPYLNLETTVTKKINIDINISLKVNKPIIVSIKDNINTFTIKGPVISNSITTPITKDNIIKQLSKLNNTPYKLNNINIDMDNNIFINLKELNILRRSIVDKLNTLRIGKSNYIESIYTNKYYKKEDITGISVIVNTKEQLDEVLKYNIDRIYTSNKELLSNKVKYKVPRDLYNIDNLSNDMLLTDYSEVYKYNNSHSDYFLNITNSYSIDFLSKYTKLITISPEVDINRLKNMSLLNKNVEVYIYGKLELMLMKYCPLKYLLNKDKVCSICKNNNKYYLKDRNNYLYRIITNRETDSTILYDYKNINLLNNIEDLNNLGIKNYRIEFLDENKEEVKNILERVINNE